MKLLLDTDKNLRDSITKLYKYLESNPGEYTLKLNTFRATRSLNQNAYYFVILDILRKYFGYTDVMELHKDMKALHGLKTQRENKLTKQSIVEDKSTTKYSNVEFNSYIEQIRNWAKIEYNIDTPEPE